ncbi:MAG: superoxide dismutase family protein [Phycisphaeraceae bacterium]
MKPILTTAVLLVAAVVVGVWALPLVTGPEAAAQEQEGGRMAERHAEIFDDVTEAVAVIHPTHENDVRGWVRFRERDNGRVRVTAELEGLNAGQAHGFHIHEYGDCTAGDGTSAGSHYNPADHPHGLPNGDERHAGDLGNLEANDDGVATLELTVSNVTVAGLRNPILGRGVIVHAEEDDGSQPLGGAGARLGCGVIGIAEPREQQ